MSTEPWPPEGTRVRVLVLDDDNEGELMIGKISGPCVLLKKGLLWPVERHEIEVIDDHS